MGTTTHIHGPYQFEAHRAVRDGVYVQFDILDKHGNRVHLYFTSREQADALIAAAIDTEHVLAGAGEPAKPLATVCPICGTCLEPSGRCAVCTAVPIGEYPVSHLACGCQVQDVMPIGPGTPMVCERHGGTHVIPAETAPCPPGTCITCGATVSGAGVVTPAATP